MSKFEAKKVVKLFANELVLAGYPVARVFLFGSYITGKAGKWSDLDVAIVSKKRIGTIWNNERFLSRISLKVDNRLEPHSFTTKEFANNSDPMVYEIKKTGIRVV